MTLLLAMLKCDPSQRVQRVQDLREFEFFKDNEHQQFLKDMEFGARSLMKHDVLVHC
jgi:hypothetical protein